MAELYRQSKIVVCSSLLEGGPRVIVEGMACGIPGISSSVGFMPSVIKDGENGFLIPSFDPKDFAEKIELLLSNKELRDKMGNQASERC